MTLSEKIYYCRRKAGLSQEELAQRLGVSRQAVSKWETGEADPELGKLRLLAEAFGVSADWLLSGEEPPEEKTSEAPAAVPDNSAADWLDAVPGFIGRMLRKYGWLFGVYLAVAGAAFTGLGALARFMVNSMLSSFGSIGGQGFFDPFGGTTGNIVSGITRNNPVAIMGTFIIILGIVMIIVGVVLAIVLKKRADR